jgi:hypothetical protein
VNMVSFAEAGGHCFKDWNCGTAHDASNPRGTALVMMECETSRSA